MGLTMRIAFRTVGSWRSIERPPAVCHEPPGIVFISSSILGAAAVFRI